MSSSPVRTKPEGAGSPPEAPETPPDRGAYSTMFVMGAFSAPYLLLWLFRAPLDALASILAKILPIFAPRVAFLEVVSPETKAVFAATLVTGVLMAGAHSRS